MISSFLSASKQIVQNNQSNAMYRKRLATRHMQVAGDYKSVGRPLEALEQFRLAAKADSADVKHHIRLGIALQELKRYDESMTALDEAIRRDPKSEWAYRIRGLNYQRQGKLKEALRELDRAAVSAPDAWQPHYTRGKLLRDMRRYDDALACFNRVVELNPKYGWGYYYRAQTRLKRSQFQTARQDFETANRLTANNTSFMSYLAWILATCPDPTIRDGKRAVAFATKACELTKWKNGGYLDTLAAAYAEAGDFKQAVESQQKAMKLLPETSLAGAKSRLALYKSGKPYHEPRTRKAPARARKPKSAIGVPDQRD